VSGAAIFRFGQQPPDKNFSTAVKEPINSPSVISFCTHLSLSAIGLKDAWKYRHIGVVGRSRGAKGSRQKAAALLSFRGEAVEKSPQADSWVRGRKKWPHRMRRNQRSHTWEGSTGRRKPPLNHTEGVFLQARSI